MSVPFAVENLMNILHTEVFETFGKANWLELSRVRKIRGKEVSFGSIYLEFRKNQRFEKSGSYTVHVRL